MLDIVKTLFLSLNEAGVEYRVYKGLTHLEQDFNGARGDVDIFVVSEDVQVFQRLANKSGFFKVERAAKTNDYYQGYDVKAGKGVLLDVVSAFNFAVKGRCTYTPAKKELSACVASVGGVDVKTVSLVDSAIIQLLTCSFVASAEKIDAFKRVFNSLDIKDFESSDIKALFLNKASFEDCLGFLLGRIDKSAVRSFLGEHVSGSSRLTGNGYLNSVLQVSLESLRRVGRFLGRPRYKVSSGKMFAVVGVDGSGKSTVVHSLECNGFFKLIGIKRIYFGANEFLTPGLLQIYQISSVRRWLFPLKVGAVFLMFVERHARLVKAAYLKWQGNIVICDRYFYDDEVFRAGLEAQEGSSIMKALKTAFLAKVYLVPNKTFFLNVSPVVAYQRKQDFSYEKMLKVNEMYRVYMKSREEVKFVDADLPLEHVKRVIYDEIVNELKGVS